MTVVDCKYNHSEEEFKELTSFVKECYSIYQNSHNWFFSRLENWKYANWDEPLSKFTDNVHLWRDRDGKLVGFCISERGGNRIEIQIHPKYRDLENEMYAWTHDNWAKGKDQVETIAYQHDLFRQGLLRNLGYEDVGECGYFRKYDLSKNYPQVELEDGFFIQDLAQNMSCASRIEAESATFNAPFLDENWFNAKTSAPSYSHKYDFSVISPKGKHVAFCVAWLDHKNRIAEIDPVGTHPDFRKKGFAKAVIIECFKRLKDAGMQFAYISSGPEPYVSNRLYDSLGPVAKYQERKWVKKLR